MATKSGQKGRYICKVGFYDVYAKDTFKPKKDSKFKFTKPDVASTVYNILHAKKLVEKGFKTKDDAVTMAKSLLGDKATIYGLS
jgi:hypothetical protein